MLSWQLAGEERWKKASKAQEMELIIKSGWQGSGSKLIITCGVFNPLFSSSASALMMMDFNSEKWMSKDENCGMKLKNHDMMEVRFNLQKLRRWAAFKDKVEMDKIMSIVNLENLEVRMKKVSLQQNQN